MAAASANTSTVRSHRDNGAATMIESSQSERWASITCCLNNLPDIRRPTVARLPCRRAPPAQPCSLFGRNHATGKIIVVSWSGTSTPAPGRGGRPAYKEFGLSQLRPYPSLLHPRNIGLWPPTLGFVALIPQLSLIWIFNKIFHVRMEP